MWNSAFDDIKEEDDPAESIERYIRAKLEYSRKHARASRIFTSEIIHGAPHVKDRLQTMSKRWLEERSGIIHNWIKLGKLRPVDPFHLFFLIWSSTQYYADYEAEVSLIYGKPSLDKKRL